MDAPTAAPAQAVPFQFTGTAREYFGIWIVNLLLTILTLGIYAAWAKVRTQRYFYGNTVLDGSAFDYLATPLAILKGWAIAIAVLIVYNIVSGLYPVTGIVFFILFLLALPWIVVRSLMFRAHNSSYRNIRFTFQDAYSEAVRVFIGLGLLIPISLGLAYPYYVYAMNRFMVNNSGYGSSGFRTDAPAKAFYKIYLIAGVLLIGFVALAGTVVTPMMKNIVTEMQTAAPYQPALPQAYPDADAESDAYGGVAPDCAAAFAETDAESDAQTDGSCEEDPAAELDPATLQRLIVMQVAMSGFFGLFYLMAFAYLQARTGNLVFNHTELSGHRFLSTLRARDLMWLYFSNALGIILSFGLLIPWARVRMARYRAEHLALQPNGSLDNFAQSQRGQVGATGEELGEVFAVDIGL